MIYWALGPHWVSTAVQLQGVLGAGPHALGSDPLGDGARAFSVRNTTIQIPITGLGDRWCLHMGARYEGTFNFSGVDPGFGVGPQAQSVNLRETSARWRVYRQNATVHDRPSSELRTNYHWALDVYEHASEGWWRLYRNGSEVASEENVNTSSSASERFLQIPLTSKSGANIFYSHIVLADEFLGELVRVKPWIPSSDLGPNDMIRSDTSLSHHAHLSSIPTLGDSRYLETDEFEQATRHGGDIDLDGLQVLSFTPSVLARVDGAGASQLEVDLDDGVSSTGNALLAELNLSFYRYFLGTLHNENPLTSSPWTNADLDSLAMKIEQTSQE